MKIKKESSCKPIRRSVTLEESVSNDLDLYAEFICSSPNYVINQILSAFFLKDKDFQSRKNNYSSTSSDSKPHRSRKNSSSEDATS